VWITRDTESPRDSLTYLFEGRGGGGKGLLRVRPDADYTWVCYSIRGIGDWGGGGEDPGVASDLRKRTLEACEVWPRDWGRKGKVVGLQGSEE